MRVLINWELFRRACQKVEDKVLIIISFAGATTYIPEFLEYMGLKDACERREVEDGCLPRGLDRRNNGLRHEVMKERRRSGLSGPPGGEARAGTGRVMICRVMGPKEKMG